MLLDQTQLEYSNRNQSLTLTLKSDTNPNANSNPNSTHPTGPERRWPWPWSGRCCRRSKTACVDQTQSAQGPTPAAAAYFPLVVRSLGVACSLTRRLGIQLLPQIATFSANGITSLPPLGARQSHLPHTSTCRLYRMYRTFVPLPCSYSGLSDGLAAPIRQRLPAIALSGNNIRQVFAHVCLCHQAV